MRHSDSMWNDVCIYFSTHPMDKDISIKDFLKHFKSSKISPDYTTIDNYRRFLSSSGYLKLTGVGVYQRIKDIPKDLMVKDVIGVKVGNEKGYQLWYRMIQYHRTLEIGSALASKDYRKEFNPTNCSGQARILDVYKSKLKLGGIIESAGWGKYKVIKIPEADLRISNCKK